MRRHMQPQSIQMTIAISFTIVSLISMGCLGISLYSRFVNKMQDMTTQSAEQLLNQTAINLEDYLRNMRRISDAMYYSVIKDKDLGMETLDEEMNLLYEANKDNLISIACYTNDGGLVAAAPVATEKEHLDIVNQEWFTEAVGQMENVHFSTPHVQNLFDDSSYRYYWVVSLSRAVELTNNGNSTLGVLLVDMNYSSIEQLLTKANTDNASEYIYLMDSNGEIIYHPKQKLIYTNLYEENNLAAAAYEDGSVQEEFGGEKRLVTVKTISYTGWKLVSVVPMSSFEMGLSGMRMFVILLTALVMLMIIILNQLVSARIANPLQKLNESVKEWEAGNLNPDIYVGGSLEVEHLGKTLRSTVEQIRELMHDILVEQEEKRKSELDALQSQINPHFLYNTLDSIVWMIEGERYEDAVFMITQLASLFRISLSRGKTIISIEDEVKHAKNYMNIQKIRYKNIFSIDFEIDEDILNCCTVKLVIQPLLENAIYYGVECMDGDGEIRVVGYRKEHDVYIEVRDNGLGMPKETVEALLTENNRVRKSGSGVGLINVHNRIRLRFGNPYGLEIESQPDEGTTVRIHLPDIVYSQETVELLEGGKLKQLKGERKNEEK
ncbi:MAG: sensor histidine kinase [Clostridiales bacterium]|nr:sensor histidine kinase [Clostridiales bacterium]MDY4113664.1 sensor histidine kinase [Roseburia sp.]